MKNEGKHTPTPWTSILEAPGFNTIYNINGVDGGEVGDAFGEANAKLIILAVNCHYELLEALRDLRGIIIRKCEASRFTEAEKEAFNASSRIINKAEGKA